MLRTQCQHEAYNRANYPGTRQLCIQCNEPTGKCEDDTISYGDISPLCEECYDLEINKEILKTREGM